MSATCVFAPWHPPARPWSRADRGLPEFAQRQRCSAPATALMPCEPSLRVAASRYIRIVNAWRRGVLIAALVLLAPVGPASADNARVETYKEFALVANSAWSDCPWDSTPADGTECATYYVEFGQYDAALNGGPVSPRSGDWFAYVSVVREVFDAPTDTFRPISAEYGDFALNGIPGEIDRRLESAHLDGPITASLRAYDAATGSWSPSGHTVTVGPLDWSARGDRMVFGVGGPAAPVPHLHTPCETTNSLAHQKAQPAVLAGTGMTVDGIPVSELAPYQNDPPAAILYGVFHASSVDKTQSAGCERAR